MECKQSTHESLNRSTAASKARDSATSPLLGGVYSAPSSAPLYGHLEWLYSPSGTVLGPGFQKGHRARHPRSTIFSTYTNLPHNPFNPVPPQPPPSNHHSATILHTVPVLNFITTLTRFYSRTSNKCDRTSKVV